MKLEYRGFELNACRESVPKAPLKARSFKRPQRLFYSAIRISDGFILDENNMNPSMRIGDAIKGLKYRVDDYLQNGDSSSNLSLCPP